MYDPVGQSMTSQTCKHEKVRMKRCREDLH